MDLAGLYRDLIAAGVSKREIEQVVGFNLQPASRRSGVWGVIATALGEVMNIGEGFEVYDELKGRFADRAPDVFKRYKVMRDADAALSDNLARTV